MTEVAQPTIEGRAVHTLGNAGHTHVAHYSTELNQFYLACNTTGEIKTLTHEEYIDICIMRREIETLAREKTAPIKVIGIAADVEKVLFSSEYNMVYLMDTVMEETTRLTLNAYFAICNMRRKVEALAGLNVS